MLPYNVRQMDLEKFAREAPPADRVAYFDWKPYIGPAMKLRDKGYTFPEIFKMLCTKDKTLPNDANMQSRFVARMGQIDRARNE